MLFGPASKDLLLEDDTRIHYILTVDSTLLGLRISLSNLTVSCTRQSEIRSIGCITKRINWSHIPSRAPHFGGLWEAAVKAMKSLLAKVVGSCILTIEEMFTVLAEVEVTVNSRPLVPLDSTPIDGIVVLTPAHFLVGRPLLAIPECIDKISNTRNVLCNHRWQAS